MSIPRIASLLKDAESELKDSGRVFIRYSGTEPLVRITVEGTDEGRIKKMGQDLVDVIEEELG
jgi:phosphoglucosamine mutase